jgi:hypothetical protein
MRFQTGANALRISALGPAAAAGRLQQAREWNQGMMRAAPFRPNAPAIRRAQSASINRGVPPIDLRGMMRGGSTGLMGCCGLGDLSGNAPPKVIVGPIAARIISLRRSGVSPQIALLDALTALHSQGVQTITPEIHLQLAAGLQPFPQGLSGLGALGLPPVVGGAMTGAAVGAFAVSTGAAAALGIGAGIAIGQTMIPIPGVGAVIGAVVFEAMQLMKRHVGKAEAAWANQSFYNSLRVMNGRDYDEQKFSEAFKGMMDTGNNIVPGCGPDRHKNPDCLLGPMAGVIAQGYLSGAVPLTATTAQMFQTVVKPWLMSGAGGLVNGAALAAEPIQLLMMQAATDRYMAGQAMTRGDMPAYAGQGGAHTPTLLQALQPMLRAAAPMTTTPQVVQSTPGDPLNPPATNAGGPAFYRGNPPVVNVQDGTGGANPPIYPVAVSSSMSPGTQGSTGYPTTYAPYPPIPSGGPAIGTQIVPGQSAPMSAPGGLTANLPWGLILAAGVALLS